MNPHLFFRTLVIAAALGTSTAFSLAQEDALITQAKDNVDAVLKGDYARIVEYTHPDIVRGMGGKEVAIAITRQTMEQLKTQGAEMVSIVPGKPSKVVLEGTDKVAFVPYAMRMKMNGKEVSLDSYLVAVLIPGNSRWAFIDGSSINEALLARQYPTLVSEVGIPKRRNSIEEDIRAMSDKMKKDTGKSLEEVVEERLAESKRVISLIDAKGLRATIERHYGKSLKKIPTSTLKEYLKKMGTSDCVQCELRSPCHRWVLA